MKSSLRLFAGLVLTGWIAYPAASARPQPPARVPPPAPPSSLVAAVPADSARPALPGEEPSPPRTRLTSRPASGTPAAPGKLTPENFHSPKLRGWINDVPDTGQF